jgi:DNA-directed RNA polymerase specialized sigma24 family protein
MKPTGEQKAAVLGALSARNQRACTMAWVEGLTHEQVAAAEGVSRWAAMKRVQRARRRLRAMGLDAPSGVPRKRLRVVPLTLQNWATV